MMGLLGTGVRDGNRFMARLVQQAAHAREAVAFLESCLDRVEPATVEHLRGLSHQATEARRMAIDDLHESFVTPIDREDIYNLTQSFERMVTYALTTLEEMHLLRVEADAPIRGMVACVREQAEELEDAMRRLPRHPRVADDHANHVHDKEREVERLYRDAIRDLFARAGDARALPGILYRREVYRHISNMADRAVSAANVLGMVVMKVA